MQTVFDVLSSLLIVVITIVYMNAVLELRVKSKAAPWLIGFGFFALAEIMECIRVPKAWMAILTIAMIASICVCYFDKNKILPAVVFLVITLFLSEPAAYFAIEIFSALFPAFEYIELLIAMKPLLSRLLAMGMLLFCSRVFHLLYQRGHLPLRKILGCIFIPLLSLGLIYTNYHMFFEGATAVWTLISTVIILAINAIAFRFLVLLKAHYDEQIDFQKKAEQLDAFYYQQDKLVEHLVSVRQVEHNMENTLVVVHASLRKGDISAALTLIEHELQALNSTLDAKTGLFIVDSVINYKMKDAEKIQAAIEIDQKISDELELQWAAVGIILSTALDNAIEACADNPPDQRKIKVYIGTHNQILILRVVNSFCGDRIPRPDGLFDSTKKNSAEHGRGLGTIMRTVKANKGDCDFLVKGNTFEVSILLSETP